MDQPPKQSFNFTFYWHISQIGTFLHVKQPCRNPSPPQHTAPSLSFSLLAFWRSTPLLLRKILRSLYHVLKCRPMVKDGLEFICFFYSCILLPEIVIQNSQLLTNREGGNKAQHSRLQAPLQTATEDPGWPSSPRWIHLPRSLAMPTISGHFMKYRLATQLTLAANANTKRPRKIRGRTSLLRGGPLSTDRHQTHAPLGKLLSPWELPQRWLNVSPPPSPQSTTFLWAKLSFTQQSSVPAQWRLVAGQEPMTWLPAWCEAGALPWQLQSRAEGSLHSWRQAGAVTNSNLISENYRAWMM